MNHYRVRNGADYPERDVFFLEVLGKASKNIAQASFFPAPNGWGRSPRLRYLVLAPIGSCRESWSKMDQDQGRQANVPAIPPASAASRRAAVAVAPP